MEELIPSEFYLSQNFPNPFWEKTVIKYCLPISAKVNLILLNPKGTKIKTMVDKIQAAGTYELKYEGHDLPVGIYYYQIKLTDPELTNKNTSKKKSKQLYAETKQMLHRKQK
ncbi:MAG: hypothetical protein HND52_19635 [Ignavibacteriae bacterium]|nr:hypothetical protein [Ignavibacteriota bacterium]NOH00180.1 hypothetical protein [Ignavibacteriota bacterium]